MPDSVVLDPPLADRTPVDPALAPPDEVLPVGPTLLPFEVAELDAEEFDVDGLGVDGRTLADVDFAGVALDVGVGIGLGVDVPQGFPVGGAFVSPGMLLFAAAEAAAGGLVVLPVALAVGVLVLGVLVLGVLVLEGVVLEGVVVLSVGLVLLLVGLAPVLLVVGLVAGTGVTLGLSDVLAVCERDGDEVGAHAVAGALLVRLPGMLLGPATPADEFIGPPVPFVPWVPPPPPLLLLLWELIPTAEPSWTKAWRSGGTARATPTANTAQATARPDRSNPYRQSRGWRRAWPGPEPCAGEPCPGEPPRMAFQRRTLSARKPPTAVAPECLLAYAGPDRTRARIRSSPSGRGSTWSAAACRA